LFGENGHHGQSKNRTSLVKNKKVGEQDALVNHKKFLAINMCPLGLDESGWYGMVLYEVF